jgi:hypothetical protein
VLCVYVNLCLCVCMNRAARGNLSCADSLENRAKKDVEFRERIAPIIIERCTG